MIIIGRNLLGSSYRPKQTRTPTTKMILLGKNEGLVSSCTEIICSLVCQRDLSGLCNGPAACIGECCDPYNVDIKLTQHGNPCTAQLKYINYIYILIIQLKLFVYYTRVIFSVINSLFSHLIPLYQCMKIYGIQLQTWKYRIMQMMEYVFELHWTIHIFTIYGGYQAVSIIGTITGGQL